MNAASTSEAALSKRPSVLRRLARRLARIAIMLIVCAPALVMSSHMDQTAHREEILLAVSVLSLAAAFWAMEHFVPMRGIKNGSS